MANVKLLTSAFQEMVQEISESAVRVGYPAVQIFSALQSTKKHGRHIVYARGVIAGERSLLTAPTVDYIAVRMSRRKYPAQRIRIIRVVTPAKTPTGQPLDMMTAERDVEEKLEEWGLK